MHLPAFPSLVLLTPLLAPSPLLGVPAQMSIPLRPPLHTSIFQLEDMLQYQGLAFLFPAPQTSPDCELPEDRGQCLVSVLFPAPSLTHSASGYSVQL